MVYEDLEVEISRCCCGQLEVRILESPVDRPRERLDLTPERLAALWRRIERYDELIIPSSAGRQGERRKLAMEIGTELFLLLTPGKVGRSLREALLLLDREREERAAGRRLRLSFGAGEHFDPGVANLPWELIYDPEGGGRFLGGEPQTQIVRYLDVTRKIRPLRVEPPLRVLAVLSSPSSQQQIDLAVQWQRLQRAAGQQPGRIELHRLPAATLETLKATLAEHEALGRPFHALHFLGHGELTEEGDGALYFEKEDRSEHIVGGQLLARQLTTFRDLRLVVLASCEGARIPRRAGRNPFTGSASALVAANVPAVVAMQFSVSEMAAAAFTSGFYAKVGAGGSLVEAVAESRLWISAEDPESAEWATPVLFLRPADGRVLEVREAAGKEQEGTRGERVAVSVRSQRLRSVGDSVITGITRRAVARHGSGAVKVDVSSGQIDAGGDLRITGVEEA